MKNTFNTSNQFWTEIAASAGMIGDLAAASSCLTANEVAIAGAIRDYGVTNSYWRSQHKLQFIALLRKVMERYPGAAD